MDDNLLNYHKSFKDLLAIFRNIISSLTWLKISIPNAIIAFQKEKYIITLDCSVIADKSIKIDKSILNLVKQEGFNKTTPLFSKSLINFFRVFTIAVKDVIWEEADFKRLLNKPELQFLRHLRNACAHNNKFYWGNGRLREKTLKSFPTIWRGKKINKEIEGKSLFFEFLTPGDLFILLADISALTKKNL